MTSVSVVPLRGVRFRDTELESNPFERPWTLLSLDQMRALATRHPDAVGGNIKMIEERIHPDAFLLVACDNPSAPAYRESYDRAESIIGAICITTLLAPEHREDTRQYSPRPLYWARAIEYCDLPLVFDEQRTRLSGHSSWFMWLSPDNAGIGGKSLEAIGHVEKLAMGGPAIVKRILTGQACLDEADRRLEEGLRALHAGFQAASPGQFIANMVSAAEVVVARPDERWWQRANRLKVLTGPEYWTRIEELLAARHAYVHEARQPSAAFLAHAALGLAVQVWEVMHDLCARARDVSAVLDEIDALARKTSPRGLTTRDLTRAHRRIVEELYTPLPRGPARRLYWLNHALTDVQPNDYYEKFVIFGEMLCPQCKHWLGREVARTSTPETETAECPRCRAVVTATLPFNEHR
jgi:hypothetical protein